MIDDLINNANNKDGYDKQAYIKKKNEQLEQAYNIIDGAIDDIKSNPVFFKEYLNIQSRFDMYTPRNAMLVAKQLPNAIQLKEWKKWKEANISFKNRYPKKILILDPSEPYRNKDGKLIQRYNAKEVIDVSETNTKPNIKSYDKKFILQALLHECPIEIKAVDSLENGKVCNWNTDDKVLYVSKIEDLDLLIKSISTELAKINLFESTNELNEDKADCISYMICKKYGIEASVDSIDKLISKYSNMEKFDVVNDLSSMKEVALDINTRMRDYLEEKTKCSKSREQER